MTHYPEPPPVSPVVDAEGRVTFHLWAPNASTVVAHNTTGGYGDWPGGNDVPLARDAEGLWSVTIGPLDPEYYKYVYLVDDVPALENEIVSHVSCSLQAVSGQA